MKYKISLSIRRKESTPIPELKKNYKGVLPFMRQSSSDKKGLLTETYTIMVVYFQSNGKVDSTINSFKRKKSLSRR